MTARREAAARLGRSLRLALLAGAALVVPACGGSSQSSSAATACTDGTNAACYTGPPGTEGVGACHAGMKTCAGGAFGPCLGEQVPAAETCNGVDDDCNGTADDGAGASCSSGVCAMGTCQPPTCGDGVKNGDETGIDCGGPTCSPCAAGQGCLGDGDCQSGMCFASVCRSDLDGCTPAGATDLTAQGSVTISFPVGPTTFAYDKPCIKVSVGAVVTFSGDFTLHPLQGGAVLDGVPTPATSGPFVPATSSGTLKAFTLAAAGSYPYYCQVHGTLGMKGAVFVVP